MPGIDLGFWALPDRSRLSHRILVLPEAHVYFAPRLPFVLGSGTALIVVCTILDIKKQVRDLSLTKPGGERI